MASRGLAALIVLLAFACAPAHAVDFGTDSFDDQPDQNAGDGICETAVGTCTLRAGVMEAVALPSDDTVLLGSGTYQLGSDLDVLGGGALTIEGFTKETTTISTDGSVTGFLCHCLGTIPSLVIRDVTVSGFRRDTGPVLFSVGGLSEVVFQDTRLTGNGTETPGGGPVGLVKLEANLPLALRFTRSIVDGNTDGGAFSNGEGMVKVEGGSTVDLEISDSTFQGNESAETGTPGVGGSQGIIYLANLGAATVDVDRSGFYDNLVATSGFAEAGVLYFNSGSGSTLNIRDSDFSGNQTGGGSWGQVSFRPNGNSSLVVDRSSFTFNTTTDSSVAAALGVAAPATNAMSVANTHFEGNVSGDLSSAGAVAVDAGAGGLKRLRNVTFVDNRVLSSAPNRGGAIYSASPGVVRAHNLVFQGNQSDAGFHDCSNSLIDESGNVQALTAPNEGCGLNPARTGLNPGLGPLDYNGAVGRNRIPQASGAAFDGGTTPCPALDIRSLPRPAFSACDAGAAEAQPSPPQAADPQPASPAQQAPAQAPGAPEPALGAAVVIGPAGGSPLIRLPGTRRFVPLTALMRIPVGTEIDARKGRVTIVSARPGGGTQSFTYYDGIFRVGQGRDGVLTVTLVEQLSCTSRGKAKSSARKPRKRGLWGDGKGNAKTNGRYGAAVVRGTKWLVEDTCTTTKVRVAEGTVTAIEAATRKQRQVNAPRTVVFRAR